jgi:AbrB family looped-hinge helix DNA binding protein
MTTVTVSPKFQIVIPKTIRQAMKLKAGTKMEMILYGNRIELIPIKPIKQLKGSLKGIDTTIIREKGLPNVKYYSKKSAE